MTRTRKDSKGRSLHVGESQRKDGRYVYTYMFNGKRVYVYDTDLARLREKERQIQKDLLDGIRTYEASHLTLNDIFKTYMETKTALKKSTLSNYNYMWTQYVQSAAVANKPLNSLRKSDIKVFYSRLLERGLSTSTLENINNLLHPTLELAVDDDLIRKNPSDNVYAAFKKSEKPHESALPESRQQFF